MFFQEYRNRGGMKKDWKIIKTITILISFFRQTWAEEKQSIAGAGSSTKIVQMFFTEFGKLAAAEKYTFTVPSKSVISKQSKSQET